MTTSPADELRRRLRRRGILTMAPEQGGITALLCDMDECHRPRGRWDFDPIPDPIPSPIPEWIPTEDHFPRTKEAGGTRLPGNVRLAHRLCNRADYGVRGGHPQEAHRARVAKEDWHREFPGESAANAERYTAAEAEWAAMRRATDVRDLEGVQIHLGGVDAGDTVGSLWIHIVPVTAGNESLVYVRATPSSFIREIASFPFEFDEDRIELRLNARGQAIDKQIRSPGVDSMGLVAVGPIAIGPIAPITPKIAAVETALAGHLLSRGYPVLAEPRQPYPFDQGLFKRVCELINNTLPA